MKKIMKLLCLVMAMVCLCSALAGCSNISESYADKVNKAAESDEHYTYTQVLEDLGEDAIDITVLKTGVIIAVKGCQSKEDLQKQLDEGKTVKGIVVTMLGGKAMSATYKEITEDDLK